MKKIIGLLMISFFVIGFKSFFDTEPNKNIKNKIELIKESIKSDGYNPIWVRICGKRSKLYNKLLPGTAKKSYHLKGDAIDIYVYDIDGDNIFTKKDVDIIREHNLKIEKKYPKLQGGFLTYLSNKTSKINNRLIHFDTRGYHKECNF